jgi:hypothetical protein
VRGILVALVIGVATTLLPLNVRPASAAGLSFCATYPSGGPVDFRINGQNNTWVLAVSGLTYTGKVDHLTQQRRRPKDGGSVVVYNFDDFNGVRLDGAPAEVGLNGSFAFGKFSQIFLVDYSNFNFFAQPITSGPERVSC